MKQKMSLFGLCLARQIEININYICECLDNKHQLTTETEHRRKEDWQIRSSQQDEQGYRLMSANT